jgi:hypothetical protein
VVGANVVAIFGGTHDGPRHSDDSSRATTLNLIQIKNTIVATVMSALGQKQTSANVWMMSALPPKADIVEFDP